MKCGVVMCDGNKLTAVLNVPGMLLQMQLATLLPQLGLIDTEYKCMQQPFLAWHT
jgi:hypothetical protein